MLILLSWLEEKSLLEEKLFQLVQQRMMKNLGSLQLENRRIKLLRLVLVLQKMALLRMVP